MVPEFGPFVVCVLEHTLRVVRSDSKSLTLPQRSAIVLYVAGVLNDMLRMQVLLLLKKIKNKILDCSLLY
jgi:hypothetical protein